MQQSDGKKRKWSDSMDDILSIFPKAKRFISFTLEQLFMRASISDDHDRKRRIIKCDRSESTDMISQLPNHILQHILSFLSQNEAIQTSILSKSWRYLGPTRPNVEFRLDAHYYGCIKLLDYLSIIDQTLLRYQDQNLCAQEFIVEMITVDPETISHVEKWILILVLGGVETLDLMFYVGSGYFDLPSVVFEAKSLRKLCLLCCKLRRNSIDKVLFTHLHTLSLTKVYIDDEAFEKIMSTCIFIERVVLERCPGLTNVSVGNSTGYHYYNLKHFDFTECPRDVKSYYDYHFHVEIGVPTLETIKMYGRFIRYDHDDQRNIYFPRLKSLSMFGVMLYRESFDILFSNLPCLQDLSIECCGGFKELRIVNPPIKHLTISSLSKCIRKVTIDAPNIEEFVFKNPIQCPLSVTTTSREWKSSIHMCYGGNFNDDHSSSSWFLELHELLEAVSQSEISLRLSQHTSWRFQYRSDDGHIEDIFDGLPVLVEDLDLSLIGHSSASLVAFLMRVFGCCRPRNIRTFWIDKPQDERQLGGKRLTEFLCETLIMKRGRGRRYSWRQDLEQASMEVFDQSGKRWRSVKGKRFSASGAALFPNLEEVCFKLKWREYK